MQSVCETHDHVRPRSSIPTSPPRPCARRGDRTAQTGRARVARLAADLRRAQGELFGARSSSETASASCRSSPTRCPRWSATSTRPALSLGQRVLRAVVRPSARRADRLARARRPRRGRIRAGSAARRCRAARARGSLREAHSPRNGGERQIEVRYWPHHDREGLARATSSSISDISERKRAERGRDAVAERNARLTQDHRGDRRRRHARPGIRGRGRQVAAALDGVDRVALWIVREDGRSLGSSRSVGYADGAGAPLRCGRGSTTPDRFPAIDAVRNAAADLDRLADGAARGATPSSQRRHPRPHLSHRVPAGDRAGPDARRAGAHLRFGAGSTRAARLSAAGRALQRGDGARALAAAARQPAARASAPSCSTDWRRR